MGSSVLPSWHHTLWSGSSQVHAFGLVHTLHTPSKHHLSAGKLLMDVLYVCRVAMVAFFVLVLISFYQGSYTGYLASWLS